jgi:hypothetical protein
MSSLVRLAVFAACPVIGYGQSSVCDPDLAKLVNPKNPASYRLRVTRCEGVYDPERAGGAALALVSFTSAVEMFDPRGDQSLFVRWASPGGSTVHFRGYSIKPRTYYQMDTVLDTGKMPFIWPLDVVRDVGLGRREIAVVAWTSYEAGHVAHDVYLPVSLGLSSLGNSQGTSPRITLMPGRGLNELYFTIQLLDPSFSPTATLLRDDPSGEGPYPPDVPITIDLKRLKIMTPGFYSLKIGATVVNGTPATLSLTLYYGNP